MVITDETHGRNKTKGIPMKMTNLFELNGIFYDFGILQLIFFLISLTKVLKKVLKHCFRIFFWEWSTFT